MNKTIPYEEREGHNNQHLCADCMYYPSNDYTTGDRHGCELFAANISEWTNNEYPRLLLDFGNTRKYEDGTITLDNGGGFWVLGCPRFIKDEMLKFIRREVL